MLLVMGAVAAHVDAVPGAGAEAEPNHVDGDSRSNVMSRVSSRGRTSTPKFRFDRARAKTKLRV